MSTVSDLTILRPSARYNDSLLVSSRGSIVNRKQVEIIPRESNLFGYQVNNAVGAATVLNDKLTFLLSDPRHLIDFKNSYFQCEFLAVGNAASLGEGQAPLGLRSFLDQGGIHSLIKTVIVRHGGAEIHRISEYNKLYNIWNLSCNSQQYRDFMLASSGDSVEDFKVSKNTDIFPITFSQTNTTYTAATNTLAAMAGAALTELAVGDILEIDATGPPVLAAAIDQAGIASATGHTGFVTSVCRVQSITDNNIVILSDPIFTQQGGAVANNYAADAAAGVVAERNVVAGGIKAIRKIGRNTQDSTRYKVVRHGGLFAQESVDNTHRLTWKIPFGLFASEEYFPLPMLNQSLEIVLEFVEPALGIVVQGVPLVTSNLGYMIRKPRFNCSFIEPERQVIEQLKMKMKEDGLTYHYINWRNYGIQRETGSVGPSNHTLQTNINSAVAVFCVMTNQSAGNSAAGNAIATQQEYCQSNFYKYDLNRFRFKSGGMSLPDYGMVECLDVASGQAWEQLNLAMQRVGYKVSESGSIRPHEWQSRNSNKFIIATPLSLEAYGPGSYNCGINLSQNFLELEIDVNTALPNSVLIHAYIAFDSVLMITDSSISVNY